MAKGGGERRMLFDIRGRRKHVVRVVYAILALLMGASLFLVVGPFNIANLVGNSSTTNAGTVLNEQAERIERKLRAEPDSEALLLSLAHTRIAAGNALTEVSPSTGLTLPTPEGQRQLEQAAVAWNRYLKQTDSVNPSTALLMSRAYFSLAESAPGFEEAVANVVRAAATQKLAAEARPTLNSLTTLGIYEYYAGNFAAGDEAAKKAEAKESGAEAKKVKKTMAEFRSRGKAFQKQKQEVAKQEKEQGKEALKNPFGGLGGGTGTLGGG